jgi:anti-sigma factor RsiW
VVVRELYEQATDRTVAEWTPAKLEVAFPQPLEQDTQSLIGAAVLDKCF